MNKKEYYSSMAKYPYKLMNNKKLLCSIKEYNKIIPINLQLSITNKCNLNCEFCSFKGRNRCEELSLYQIKKIIDSFISYGIEAITLTGGGEPLAHRCINDVLKYCKKRGVKVGIITNGLLLNKIDSEAAKAVTWCRISIGDDRETTYNLLEKILNDIIPKFNYIDWSFSYVLLPKQNHKLQIRAIKFAEKMNMINIRFIPDFFNIKKVNFDYIHNCMNSERYNISCFIEKPKISNCNNCLLYLAKPFISASGYLYACCACQYMDDNRNFNNKFRICYYTKFEKILRKNLPLKLNCTKCNFSAYNHFLLNGKEGKITILKKQNIIHREWI